MADLLDMLAELDAPTWGDCGHKRTREGDDAHAVECFELVCPHCKLATRNAYDMWQNHDPYGWHFERFGTCWPQRWQFERVATCMACHAPTFGEWPCRITYCELHVCSDACTPRPGYMDHHVLIGSRASTSL